MNYIVKIKKKKKYTNIENIFFRYISKKYLSYDFNDKAAGKFAEELLKFHLCKPISKIKKKCSKKYGEKTKLLSDRKVHYIKKSTGKKSYYVMDIIEEDTIYECKMRRYTCTGTAGDKILGVPGKYSEVPINTKKPVQIVLFGYQEYEALNDFEIGLPISKLSKGKCKLYNFYDKELRFTYEQFSKLFIKN